MNEIVDACRKEIEAGKAAIYQVAVDLNRKLEQREKEESRLAANAVATEAQFAKDYAVLNHAKAFPFRATELLPAIQEIGARRSAAAASVPHEHLAQVIVELSDAMKANQNKTATFIKDAAGSIVGAKVESAAGG